MKLIIVCLLLISSLSQASLRLASYNIRNFDYDERSNIPTNKKYLVQLIEEMRPDLMAVQEINEKEVFDQMITNNFNFKYATVLSDCGGSHGQKLGFVFDTNKMKLLHFSEDLRTVNVGDPRQASCHEGSRPVAVAIFKRLDNNQTIVALSVHLKSGGQPKNIQKRMKQLEKVKEIVQEHKNKGYEHFVVMGDFNSTEYIHRAGKPHQDFKQTVQRMGGIDLSEQLSCTSYWWGGVDDLTQYPSLLDHIILSPTLLGGKMPKIQNYGHCAELKCEVTSEHEMGVSFDEVSDHCPVLTEIQ